MTIAKVEHGRDVVLVVRDGFEASDADELHDQLRRIGRDRPITVDLRAIRRIEDFVMARLARDLARGSLHVLGLSHHQLRLLRYLSAKPDDGEPPRGTSEEGDGRPR